MIRLSVFFPVISGDSSDGGLLSTFRVTQIILTDLIMQFLENMSFSFFPLSFPFLFEMPAHPTPSLTPSLSCLLSPCPGDSVALKHVEGTVVSRSHWTRWEALVAGRNAEMQTLFHPTSPRTSFLNSSLIPFVVVVESLSRVPFFFLLFTPYLMTPP